ncbi:MAG: undecaprenyl-phosphate glucose phosphotransferase [Xanthomonadales bacterium]|nr:undecaprenyl-phosphate glucose phosphotransferase [Xanthomonadales bacterium]
MTIRTHGDWLSRAAPLLDAVSLTMAGYLSWWIRFAQPFPPAHYLLALFLGLLLALAVLPAMRSYRGARWHRPLRGTLTAAPALVAVFGCLMAVAALTKTTAEFSRLWMAGWVGTSVVFMALWRWLAASMTDRDRLRVLLVGSGRLAAEVAHRLAERYGDDSLVGFVRLPGETDHVEEFGAPIVGELDRLDELLAAREFDVNELWLASDSPPNESDESLLRQLRMSSLPVRYVPDLRLLRLLRHRASEVAGMTVIELNATPLDGPDAVVKAILDRVLALVLLLVLSPLMFLIALVIRIESPGPVLFSQPRHGGGGRIIKVLKFRSMVHECNPDSRQARRDDPRVTRVGALLRRSSLDELPQLFNVLRGDMSLVGPRPHPLALNQAFSDRLAAFMQRHRVKPGITGLAQIKGYRGETDTLEKMKKRLEYDLYYIENWSLWLDMKILVRTAFWGWTDRNAY